MTMPSWAEGAAAALVLSAAVRALPDPITQPQGFWQQLYSWFFRFTHFILANFDKAKGPIQ